MNEHDHHFAMGPQPVFLVLRRGSFRFKLRQCLVLYRMRADERSGWTYHPRSESATYCRVVGLLTPEGRTRGPVTYLAACVNGVAITALRAQAVLVKTYVLWSLDNTATCMR